MWVQFCMGGIPWLPKFFYVKFLVSMQIYLNLKLKLAVVLAAQVAVAVLLFKDPAQANKYLE